MREALSAHSGDITTLMVWQSGHVDFFQFWFELFLPAVMNFLVPAAIMNGRAVGMPEARDTVSKCCRAT